MVYRYYKPAGPMVYRYYKPADVAGTFCPATLALRSAGDDDADLNEGRAQHRTPHADDRTPSPVHTQSPTDQLEPPWGDTPRRC